MGEDFADNYASDLKKTVEIIQKTKVKTVIISSSNIKKMSKVVTDIQPFVKNIVFTPNLSNIPIANMEINKLPIENVVLLNVKIIWHLDVIRLLNISLIWY